MNYPDKRQKTIGGIIVIVIVVFVVVVVVYQLILEKDKGYINSSINIVSYNGIIEAEYEKPIWLTGHIKEDAIQKEILARYEEIKNNSIALRQEFPDSHLFPYQFIVNFDRIVINDYGNINEYESILVSFYEYTGGAHGITRQIHYNIKDAEDISFDKYLEILGYNKKEFLAEVNQRLISDGYETIESFVGQIWNIHRCQDDLIGNKAYKLCITVIFPQISVAPSSAGTIVYSF